MLENISHDVSLGAFDEKVLSMSHIWLNDKDIQCLIHSTPVSEEQQKLWYASIKNKIDYKIWALLFKNIPIGVCGIKNIRNNKGEYFGYIGVKCMWGKGIGKSMMRLIESKGRKIGLTHLYLYVRKYNERAISLYKKSGYKEMGGDLDRLKFEKKL